MTWLKELPDLHSPAPWTERDERERKTALRLVALSSPLIVLWILASPLVYIFLTKSAEAKLPTLGYYGVLIHTQIVPCHGWFDVGFTFSYQIAPRTKPKEDGRLCRGLFDDDWTRYPQ